MTVFLLSRISVSFTTASLFEEFVSFIYIKFLLYIQNQFNNMTVRYLDVSMKPMELMETLVSDFQLPDFPLFEAMGESRTPQPISSTPFRDDPTQHTFGQPNPGSQNPNDRKDSVFDTSIEGSDLKDLYTAVQENFFAFAPSQPVNHSHLRPSERLAVPGYPQVCLYSNPSLGEFYQLDNSPFKPSEQFYPHPLQPVEPEYQPSHASFRYTNTPYQTSFPPSPHTYKQDLVHLYSMNAKQTSHTCKRDLQYPCPTTETQTSHTDVEELPYPHTPTETQTSPALNHVSLTSAYISAQYYAANSPYYNRPPQIRDLSGFTSPDPAYINCQVGEPCYPAPIKRPYSARTTQELLNHMRDWHNIHPKEEMAGTCRRCKYKWYFNWDRERHLESEGHVEAVWRKAAGPEIVFDGGVCVGDDASGGRVYIPGDDFFTRGPAGYKEREHVQKMRKKMMRDEGNGGRRKRVRV
jgi:hypothetical protein